MKFLVYAAAAVSALLGVQAGAPTQQPPQPQCEPLNFLEKAGDFASLNMLLNVAVSSGMLSGKIPDPMVIKSKRLDAIPFSVVGVNFAITPVIQTLDVTGLKTVVPRPLNATAPSAIDLGADFTGDFTMQSTLRFEIAQLNKQWWQVCWVNFFSKDCSPALVDVDVAVGLNKFSVQTNTLVSMLQCPKGGAANCKDLTISDIIADAMSGKLDSLVGRLTRRIKDAGILKLSMGFEKMTQLSFHFHNSGPIISELGKSLFKFTTTEVNKKGDLYRTMMEISNKLFKTLINKLITEKFKPLFGATCFDA